MYYFERDITNLNSVFMSFLGEIVLLNAVFDPNTNSWVETEEQEKYILTEQLIDEIHNSSLRKITKVKLYIPNVFRMAQDLKNRNETLDDVKKRLARDRKELINQMKVVERQRKESYNKRVEKALEELRTAQSQLHVNVMTDRINSLENKLNKQKARADESNEIAKFFLNILNENGIKTSFKEAVECLKQ